MVEIEDVFASRNLPLDYWKAVVDRKKSWIERAYKTKDGDRVESGSSSGFFVFSSWLLVVVWVLLTALIFFGDIQLPQI